MHPTLSHVGSHCLRCPSTWLVIQEPCSGGEVTSSGCRGCVSVSCALLWLVLKPRPLGRLTAGETNDNLGCVSLASRPAVGREGSALQVLLCPGCILLQTDGQEPRELFQLGFITEVKILGTMTVRSLT